MRTLYAPQDNNGLTDEGMRQKIGLSHDLHGQTARGENFKERKNRRQAVKAKYDQGLIWQLLKAEKEKSLASVETDKGAEENNSANSLNISEANVNENL